MVQFCYSRLYFEIVGPKTVSCSLLLRDGEHMDRNLKKLGQHFQVQIKCPQKPPKKYYG